MNQQTILNFHQVQIKRKQKSCSLKSKQMKIGVDCRAMDFGGLKGIAQLDTWFGFPVPLTSCKKMKREVRSD